MGTYDFKLPDIGEGIAEAEIVAWHVSVGDMVDEDAPLADLMTDKATIEMSAPVGGKVIELAGDVGDLIAIGASLAVFETEEAIAPEPAPEPAIEKTQPEMAEPGSSPVASIAPPPPPPPSAGEVNDDRPRVRVAASPAVRRRAQALGIDLAEVKSPEADRIRHADLDAFLRYNAAAGYAVPDAKRPDEQVKVIGLRRRIAENMAAAKRAIPHFTYVEEIDVTKLEALRADLNATRGAKPKLTMLPFLISGICKTLPQFPMINARYDDQAGIVTRSGAVHLGMATQTDAGLMVPVIRDAESRNLWQLAAEIVRLAEAARSGKASLDELSGSTLTVTSLGPLGGIVTTPVINRPEVAIIGPNKVVERPMIANGTIAISKVMNISISCDHRVVDGWDAASFVQALKRLIETPSLLFVE